MIVQHAHVNQTLLVRHQIADQNVLPAVNVINKPLALTRNAEIHAKVLVDLALNVELSATIQFAAVREDLTETHSNNVCQNVSIASAYNANVEYFQF